MLVFKQLFTLFKVYCNNKSNLVQKQQMIQQSQQFLKDVTANSNNNAAANAPQNATGNASPNSASNVGELT
jgi:hypothetical protein